MKWVVATFLGTMVSCFMFLFGMDRLFCRSERREPQVSAIAFNRVVEENQELRSRWWVLRQESAETIINAKAIGVMAAKAIEESQENCHRAKLAEARVASLEQQLAGVKVLLDAARREGTRIPLLGEDEGERIPPQNVPLP